jgi:hypothetical protein
VAILCDISYLNNLCGYLNFCTSKLTVNFELIEVLFWYVYFLKQVKGNANFNFGNPDSKKYSEEASRCAYKSYLSSQSCDECWTSLPNNLHRPGVKPIVDQDSDDSDSEIFRVKRRTSLKVDKRDVNEAMRVNHSDHQVYFVDVL